MVRSVWAAFAPAALLAAGAPAAGADAIAHAPPVRSMLEMREQDVVRQQWDISCGAAAVAMVITYGLHHPVSEADVVSAMLKRTSVHLVRARLGFSLFDLKVYAASLGYGAEGYMRMTLDDLDALAPAIVPLRSHGFRHFVVYRGRRGGRVLVADPAFGNRTLSEHAFASAWASGIGFAIFDPLDPHAHGGMAAPAQLFLVPTEQASRASIFRRQ